MNKTKNKKHKLYKASLVLQQKIGKVKPDKELIDKAQKAIEENKVDFTPLGLQFLSELDEVLNDLDKNLDPTKFESQKKQLTDPVMELKANAKIFHYSLVGELANIMLSFLENTAELDHDALSIVRGHHDSLKVILTKKMKGDGGKNGKVMITELTDACSRYYKKKQA